MSLLAIRNRSKSLISEGFEQAIEDCGGLRCLHTHLLDAPLNRDDFVDLALLRFDLMGAIVVNEYGLPANIIWLISSGKS